MPMLDTAAAGAAGDDRARERGPSAFNGRPNGQIVYHDRIQPARFDRSDASTSPPLAKL
jgi:hypothetical protein